MCLSFVWLSLAQETPSNPTQEAQQVIPSTVITGTTGALEIYFPALKQGRVGLVRVVSTSETPINKVIGTFLERPVHFFQRAGYEGHFALLSAPLDQARRAFDLSVTLQPNGEKLTASINISDGGFIQQDVIVVGPANDLLNREIEDAELARLFELSAPVTPQSLWDAQGFQPPIQAELTSPFGAKRLFNGLYETLHTGWDYQVTFGKPMGAVAAGRVVFAGYLPIRGNYVLIDHGMGVYSGLAHLSVIYVIEGQAVMGGQIIGQVGNTGRSSSAHAHLEMLVNNQWVDPADFIRLLIPR